MWQTMREKPVSLRGIDGMFAVVEDPTHFATKELYVKAKIGTAMAVATWYFARAPINSFVYYVYIWMCLLTEKDHSPRLSSVTRRSHDRVDECCRR